MLSQPLSQHQRCSFLQQRTVPILPYQAPHWILSPVFKMKTMLPHASTPSAIELALALILFVWHTARAPMKTCSCHRT